MENRMMGARFLAVRGCGGGNGGRESRRRGGDDVGLHKWRIAAAKLDGYNVDGDGHKLSQDGVAYASLSLSLFMCPRSGQRCARRRIRYRGERVFI
jgi:hypothetical protein